MYMQKGREMTVERIEELRNDLSNMAADLSVTEYPKFLNKLMEIVRYAKEKAKEEEAIKENLKAIRAESLGGFIEIRETPKCKNSAEDTLRESQIYVAGMMDASNVIWKHLDRCLDSIRNQNGEQLN